MRLAVARRYQVMSLLGILSLLYVVGVWAWLQAGLREGAAAGVNPIWLTLHGHEQAFVATWVWVIGAAAVHGLVALVAWRRGDGEAVRGAGLSALIHVFGWWWTGVLAPPSG